MTAVAKQEIGQVAESNTVSMFERMARDPTVDVAKLEKLMELQERALARTAKEQASAAMAKAQAEMRPVAADADNPQTRSKYASYAALDRALRPIYTLNGFALSFNAAPGAPEGFVRVTCELSHVGGYSREYSLDMPADGKGAKGGDVMTKTHATGAAMSYGMRYLLKMIFNVAIGEDDRDGNTRETLSAEQAATLESLIADAGADRAKFLKWARVETIEDILAKHYADCVGMLNRKRAAR